MVNFAPCNSTTNCHIRRTAMRIELIDNRDSFVYNIVGLLEQIKRDPAFGSLTWNVSRNDLAATDSADSADALILSPGPGLPSEAGALAGIVDRYAERKPMFGICLGFQAIAEHFGAALIQTDCPRHGHRTHLSRIDLSDLVMGSLSGTFPAVGRYHSWVVEKESLPECLIATSVDEDGNLMSFRHHSLPLYATQFHPESYISDCGIVIMKSFFENVVMAQSRNAL